MQDGPGGQRPLRRALPALVLGTALALQPLALTPGAGPAVPEARADPPAWAPAHGYRAKGKGRGHKGGAAVAVPTYGIPSGRCQREAIGTVLGGIAGAAAGSQVGGNDVERLIAIVGGAALGALVGGSIGRAMDQADLACVDHTLEYAETGQSVAWEDPDAGTRYRVTPTRNFQNEAGRYCREYTATAVIDGREQQTYGTACRQPDGAWKLQS